MNCFDYENNLINDLRNVALPKTNKNLPIYKVKKDIIEIIKNNQISVIIGETGSGKTTQIPQYLLDEVLDNYGKIAVTQPRRIAAVNMAKRVAFEREETLGVEVGYEIRFDKKTCGSTKLIYMTDGILLNRCLEDSQLSHFGAIMLDEAHERTINTDTLMGMLKLILKKNKELKLIISSATLNSDKFCAYFNAPVFHCRGHMFPVQVVYSPILGYSYLEKCIELVEVIHKSNEQEGDILVFLTGQDVIEEGYEYLESLNLENLLIYRLYGALEFSEQEAIFEPTPVGKRKVILSTNIAETSVTIDGIRYVIDCGYVKQNFYNSKLRMVILEETRISQAQADQRKGRAGRTASGTCYRLYSGACYESMNKETQPDIFRQNLIDVYLKLVLLGINPMEFDFIDKPNAEDLERCGRELIELDLIDPSTGRATEEGRKLEKLPMDPVVGKILLAGIENRCSGNIAIILSMLTEKHIFIRGKKKLQNRAKEKKVRFVDETGDFLSFHKVYDAWMLERDKKRWCRDNFINDKSMDKVQQAMIQIEDIIKRNGWNYDLMDISNVDNKKCIIKCLVKGFYKNICYKISIGRLNWKFKNFSNGEVVYIHPQSVLFSTHHRILMYHEITKTKKQYMHGCCVIDFNLKDECPNEARKINFPF